MSAPRGPRNGSRSRVTVEGCGAWTSPASQDPGFAGFGRRAKFGDSSAACPVASRLAALHAVTRRRPTPSSRVRGLGTCPRAVAVDWPVRRKGWGVTRPARWERPVSAASRVSTPAARFLLPPVRREVAGSVACDTVRCRWVKETKSSDGLRQIGKFPRIYRQRGICGLEGQ